MAKIKKLTLDGATIYPATIMEAVKNRATNKTLAAELLTLAKAVNSGAATPDAALSALTALGTGYNSVVAVATTLKDFLTNATDTDTVINKWKEVEAFLSGITETQNLTGLLKNSETNVKNWANEKFVDLNTEQQIGAKKNFSSGFYIGGASVEAEGTNGDADVAMYLNGTFEANRYYLGDSWFIKGGLIWQDHGGEDDYDIHLPEKTGTIALVEDIPGTVTQSANGLMSAADKKKLDGIAAGANNYSLPAATVSVLGGVKLGSDTAQSVAANAVSATASRTYAVQKNASGQLVVNVPWSDTNTTYNAATQSTNGLMSAADKKKLDNIADGANKYSLPAATDKAIGGVKLYSAASISLGSSEAPQEPVTPPTTGAANRTYPVQTLRLGSHIGAMVVNVPWTDNNTTYNAATQSTNGLMSAADKKKLDNIAAEANKYSLPAATASVLGGVKLGSDTAQSVAANAVSATANRTYAVQKNASGQMVVNVPWSDTNTTYNAATQSANGLMSAADKKKLDAFGAATTYLTAAACNDVTDYSEITI